MIGATAFWAVHYQVSAAVLQFMSPIGLTFWRWAIAVIPLIVLAAVLEHIDVKAIVRGLPRMIVLSIIGMVGFNLLLYGALHFTTPIGASLVNAANPAVMVLLSVLLTAQRISGAGVTGILISLVGVLVVLTNGSIATLLGLQFNAGQLLMVGAIVMWSLYTIYARVPGVGPITSSAVEAGIAVVISAPFALWQSAGLPTQQPEALIGLLIIALLPSVASYVLWNVAGQLVPSSVAAIYMNLVTVFVVLIGFALGQPIDTAEIIGGALVIAGVVLTTLAAARRSVQHAGVSR